MTYGTAKDPRRFWILGLFVVIGLVALGTIVTQVGLRKQLPLPERTAALFSLAPATAQKALPKSLALQLPQLWQAALQSSSWWPVVLGAARTDSGWQTYVLVPRWRKAFIQTAAASPEQWTIRHYGLVTYVGKHDLALSEQRIRYTEAAQWGPERGWMSADLYPEQMLVAATGTPAWEIGRIQGYVDKTGLHTDLAFEQTSQNEALQLSDVSLNVPSVSSSGLMTLIQTHLALGDRPQAFSGLPMSQVNLFLDEAGLATSTRISFSQPLTELQAKELLVSFGLTSREIVRLPDGTTMVERVLFQPKEGESIFARYTTTRFGEVIVEPTAISWGSGTHLLGNAPVICGKAQPWARLSSRALSQLFASVQLSITPETLATVQLLESKGSLIACIEP